MMAPKKYLFALALGFSGTALGAIESSLVSHQNAAATTSFIEHSPLRKSRTTKYSPQRRNEEVLSLMPEEFWWYWDRDSEPIVDNRIDGNGDSGGSSTTTTTSSVIPPCHTWGQKHEKNKYPKKFGRRQGRRDSRRGNSKIPRGVGSRLNASGRAAQPPTPSPVDATTRPPTPSPVANSATLRQGRGNSEDESEDESIECLEPRTRRPTPAPVEVSSFQEEELPSSTTSRDPPQPTKPAPKRTPKPNDVPTGAPSSNAIPFGEEAPGETIPASEDENNDLSDPHNQQPQEDSSEQISSNKDVDPDDYCDHIRNQNHTPIKAKQEELTTGQSLLFALQISMVYETDIPVDMVEVLLGSLNVPISTSISGCQSEDPPPNDFSPSIEFLTQRTSKNTKEPPETTKRSTEGSDDKNHSGFRRRAQELLPLSASFDTSSSAPPNTVEYAEVEAWNLVTGDDVSSSGCFTQASIARTTEGRDCNAFQSRVIVFLIPTNSSNSNENDWEDTFRDLISEAFLEHRSIVTDKPGIFSLDLDGIDSLFIAQTNGNSKSPNAINEDVATSTQKSSFNLSETDRFIIISVSAGLGGLIFGMICMLWCRKSRYSCCNDNQPKHTSFVDDSDWEDDDDDGIDDAKDDDWLSPKLTTSTQSSSPDAYPYKGRRPRTPISPPGEYPYTARNLQKDFSPSDPFSPLTSDDPEHGYGELLELPPPRQKPPRRLPRRYREGRPNEISYQYRTSRRSRPSSLLDKVDEASDDEVSESNSGRDHPHDEWSCEDEEDNDTNQAIFGCSPNQPPCSSPDCKTFEENRSRGLAKSEYTWLLDLLHSSPEKMPGYDPSRPWGCSDTVQF